MKVEVKSLDNKKVGDIELPKEIFGIDVRTDLISRVIRWQQARRQQGTHKTKTISEISGTTKKPFRQKGTGNARQGSLRSAQMRGGSTIFGPVVRSHAHSIQKKIRRLALKSALSKKVLDKKVLVIDSLELKSSKTKELLSKFEKMGIKNALIIDGDLVNENFKKASSNIYWVDVLPTQGANVYDIVRRETLILTKDAVEKLEQRLT